MIRIYNKARTSYAKREAASMSSGKSGANDADTRTVISSSRCDRVRVCIECEAACCDCVASLPRHSVLFFFFLVLRRARWLRPRFFNLTQGEMGRLAPYRLARHSRRFRWVGFFLFVGLYFGRALIFPW